MFIIMCTNSEMSRGPPFDKSAVRAAVDHGAARTVKRVGGNVVTGANFLNSLSRGEGKLFISVPAKFPPEFLSPSPSP